MGLKIVFKDETAMDIEPKLWSLFDSGILSRIFRSSMRMYFQKNRYCLEFSIDGLRKRWWRCLWTQ